MSVMSQRRDGGWEPAIPEPFWIGWRLRKARCDCGAVFRKKGKLGARSRYRMHYRQVHQ